ncbi:hypothetical protein [Magnetococcus sp. PR-3]|uniref:hypothetical protein n=1 Tax=Magnetococcus sp. PR-3 TaxID=3120355 RepID=UPI002FCE1AC8
MFFDKIQENVSQYTSGRSLSDRIWAMLSYMGFLCLIPLIFFKDHDYVQFHARQGFVIFFVYILGSFSTVLPGIGALVLMLSIWVSVMLSIMGIISVILGKSWRIPVVYNLACKI